MMEKTVGDLFDFQELRKKLMEYMVFSEKSGTEVAIEIGIHYHTLNHFILGSRRPLFKTTAKIVNYVNANSTDVIEVAKGRKSAEA